MWLSSTAFSFNPTPYASKHLEEKNRLQAPCPRKNLLHLDSFRQQRQGKNDISKALQFAMRRMNYGITLIRPDQEASLFERLHPQDALEHLEKAKTVVFGDSHGNGLMFIENMLMFGMLKVKNKTAYEAFLNAYKALEEHSRPSYQMFIKTRDGKEYTYTEEMKQLDQEWLGARGELAQAGRLIKARRHLKDAIEVDTIAVKKKKAICVGDEINDRSPSDLLLLCAVKMIRAENPDALVFNLSNHATGFFYLGPKSVGKDLATLAQDRQNFSENPSFVQKGIKGLYTTRSMGDTYRWINALPNGEEKTTLFKEYQDLLRKQFESHTLIHQEGHVVTTHAFVSQATEKAWRHFLHRLDAQTFSDKDTPLREQSGEAYQETIARINALTHDYLVYQMGNQKAGTLSNLPDETLNELGDLILHTVDEREKPKQSHWLHGGFQSLEEAGFVPPADLCKDESGNYNTPHRIYGHTGTKDEPANGLLDKLFGLGVSCLNHTVRKFEDWQNLYVRKPGKQGKPHKENPVVIIN
jgi:hypothetical protein